MTTPDALWWLSIRRQADLRQGDLLPDCRIPGHMPDSLAPGEPVSVAVRTCPCIVMTQSCDLANDPPAHMVALCPILTIEEMERASPSIRKRWDTIRKGRVEGLHLLAPPRSPFVARDCLVVDFRQIYSLPFEHLSRYALGMGERWRLTSPYLEHLSQSFARFFMRVGLPSALPTFA